MPVPFGYLGANIRNRQEKAPLEQQYLREKAALMAAQKYYTREEFDQLMADLSDGLITVRIYDDGIVIDRKGLSTTPPRRKY